MVLTHATLLLPLITGVFATYICRYEHQQNAWKQLGALPLRRMHVYMSKYVLVAFLIGIIQALVLAGLFMVGLLQGFSDPFPWDSVVTSIFWGWVACLPLIALQLWVSTAWDSFAAPLAVNVVFTLPSILIANSENFGPWYPWAQPFLMMVQPLQEGSDFAVSLTTLFIVITGSFVVFLGSGSLYFSKKTM
ncbi:hypothetical protein SAMN05192534_11759 [Alteribacillus persepolensis]|uniref:ABC-2 type transport system permease protein n=1 Tax=Alteribacillus persepolensis TaxID=568899 RepID=A0A1G8GXV8_9BACI|nr:ABC transporter permease [Alteribacillus persepolensis]SDH99111.1 hypothetical protein SAMN05192534_11759 [Alteribacillus persepolensis]